MKEYFMYCKNFHIILLLSLDNGRGFFSDFGVLMLYSYVDCLYLISILVG